MKIIYTSQFLRRYKKLKIEIKELAEQKEEIFRKDPFNPALQTHKLTGILKEFWSFSINFKYRIIFEFGEDNIVYFHSVGDHSIYS